MSCDVAILRTFKSVLPLIHLEVEKREEIASLPLPLEDVQLGYRTLNTQQVKLPAYHKSLKNIKETFE